MVILQANEIPEKTKSQAVTPTVSERYISTIFAYLFSKKPDEKGILISFSKMY